MKQMRTAHWITTSLLAIAMVGASLSPAQARPRHHGYGGGYHGGYGHHRRDRDGFGVGDAIGVAALIGAVAIVASSMSKDRKASTRAVDKDRPLDDATQPPASGTEYGADVADSGVDDGPDSAANACADAARTEAATNGGYAEVRQMGEPRPVAGGYNIDGQVESRVSYRAAGGTTRRFTCTVKDGQVADVYISRDVVMR
jgi:hypothetical protein